MNSVWEQCMFLKPKVHNIKKNVPNRKSVFEGQNMLIVSRIHR